MRDFDEDGVFNDRLNRNVKPEDQNNESLSNLLKEWRPNTDLPPGFQASVWNRIDAKKGEPAISQPMWKAISVWFTQFAARPHVAAGYIAVFVLIGMTVGWTQGRREITRIHDDLAKRYVQTLDPYQARRQ